MKVSLLVAKADALDAALRKSKEVLEQQTLFIVENTPKLERLLNRIVAESDNDDPDDEWPI